jgi:single-strand DNA-binding protein
MSAPVHLNVAVVRGVVTSPPSTRELPSGSTVTSIEITTRREGITCSVPVVVHDQPVAFDAGEEVVVIGRVARRFFRAGGVTQSRTELVADVVLRASRRTAVSRSLAAVAAAVSG